MSTDMNAEEFAESLTGFEEIAISKRFGKESFADLPGTMSARAMVYVDLCRGQIANDEAYRQSMEMPLGRLGSYFAEDEEITPDEPTTASGKDDWPDAEQPTT